MAVADLVQHHVPMLGQAPLEGLGLLCVVCREEWVLANGTWSLWSTLYIACVRRGAWWRGFCLCLIRWVCHSWAYTCVLAKM